jgi:hypothetical protein
VTRWPGCRPVIRLLCAVPPVLVKVLVIAAKAVPATPLKRQVASSLVTTVRLASTVPTGSAPLGWPLLSVGGVVSGGGAVVAAATGE